MVKTLAVLSGHTRKTPTQNKLAQASKTCSRQLKAGKIRSFTACIREQTKKRR